MKKTLNGWVCLSVLLGITACHSMPKHVQISDNLKKQMNEFKARSVIFFDGQGKVVVTDADGKRLRPCSVKPGKEQCRGLKKEAEVLNVQSITVIESKINPNCFSIIDGNGIAYETCW